MNHLSAYRKEFPIVKNYVYLNHASVSPLPRRVTAAMRGLAEDVMLHGVNHFPSWMTAYDGVRAAAAKLIRAEPAEIAITKNTSEGLSFVANGIDWRPGDIVAGVRDDFPANYFPWLRLETRGVKLRWLELREGRIELDEIDRACRGARLFAVSFVHYISGFRIDLEAVGEICRRRGCLLVVDAVQGLGPYPVDVKRAGIHALSASAHKWLLGPEGVAMLYLDPALMEQLEVVEFGWTNVSGSGSYSREMDLRKDADRFECGTMNTVGCYGFEAALGLFPEIGVDRIAQRVDQLSDRVVRGVEAKGYRVFTPRDTTNGSGIVSFRRQDVDSDAAVKQLGARNISASQRSGWIRAAPHFYIEDEEIDRLLDLLP